MDDRIHIVVDVESNESDDNDYVEIYGFHNHGSNRNVIGNSTTESFFGAFRISGAPTTQ